MALTKKQREAQKAWVAALRSGEFNQAQGALYDAEQDGYCCLGVACKISPVDLDNDVLATYGSIGSGLTEQAVSEWTATGRKEAHAIFSVGRWVGLTSDQEDRLIQLNDNGHDFNRIADEIEGWLA